MKLLSRSQQGKTICFSILAVVVVLSPLFLAEMILRTVWTKPVIELGDPYISFSNIRPLFVLDETGEKYTTSPDRLGFFRAQQFSARKEEGVFRIFCLGGSTVQGRPYSVETAFPAWLEQMMRLSAPQRKIEAINCGGISYASYRLVPILQEVLTYQPDLIVILTGHNEFLEDRTYTTVKQMPPLLLKLHQRLLHVQTYSFGYHWLQENFHGTGKTILPPEVNTLLDLQHGLDKYHRDDTWRKNILLHFEENLHRMAQLCRTASVPICFIAPFANLKDSPPFKSVYQTTLTKTQLSAIRRYLQKAEQTPWSNIPQKIAFLEQAQALDPRHAGIAYRLGLCHALLGQTKTARDYFMQAKEEDVCPLRILNPMKDAIHRVARNYAIPCIDLETRLVRKSEEIAGNEIFLDHVHPTIETHQAIAKFLFQRIQKEGWMQLAPVDDETLYPVWKTYLQSLNKAYFEQGQRQLRRLKAWSRSRIPDSHASSDVS